MKVGDKIYCYKQNIGLSKWITEGKEYILLEVFSKYFTIIDDEVDKNVMVHFEKHFFTEKQYRKLKLNKINESSGNK